jgi:hypothetical protein
VASVGELTGALPLGSLITGYLDRRAYHLLRGGHSCAATDFLTEGGDLPVQQTVKFDRQSQAAKALGLAIPQTLSLPRMK